MNFNATEVILLILSLLIGCAIGWFLKAQRSPKEPKPPAK